MAQGVPGRLRPRIFLTFQHYKGGRSSAKCTGCLYPRRNPWYSLSEAKSTSGHMVLSGGPRKKSPVTPPQIDPRTVPLIVQHLNHYATPGPLLVQVPSLNPRCDLFCASMDIPRIWNQQTSHNFLTLKTIIWLFSLSALQRLLSTFQKCWHSSSPV